MLAKESHKYLQINLTYLQQHAYITVDDRKLSFTQKLKSLFSIFYQLCNQMFKLIVSV